VESWRLGRILSRSRDNDHGLAQIAHGGQSVPLAMFHRARACFALEPEPLTITREGSFGKCLAAQNQSVREKVSSLRISCRKTPVSGVPKMKRPSMALLMMSS